MWRASHCREPAGARNQTGPNGVCRDEPEHSSGPGRRAVSPMRWRRRPGAGEAGNLARASL